MLLLLLDAAGAAKQPWGEKGKVSLLKLCTRSLGWDNGPGCQCAMHRPARTVPLQGYTVMETKGEEENTGKLKSFMVRGFNSCFFWRMAQKACGTGASRGCNRLLCGSTEREGDVGHVFSLPAKQKDPQCPPGIGNEVGCGVFHLESVFLASAFNRRKPDVLRYARHMEKSCVCMDTHRHAHFLCDTQQVIAAKILTGKHLSLHRQGWENNNAIHNSP